MAKTRPLYQDAMPSRDPILMNDASRAKSEIIGLRRIVKVALEDALHVESSISVMDICFESNRMAVCADKVPYLWTLSGMAPIAKLGRGVGSVHKETITTCHFGKNGRLLATGSEDKRVILWNTETYRLECILEKHTGSVYKVAFFQQDERLATAGEDGIIYIWDWKHRHILHNFMRHPAAIRDFDFFEFEYYRFLTARADGYVSAWDAKHMRNIENLMPDPEWTLEGNKLAGWTDKRKHHSGSILCLKISPNRQLLATGSMDSTVKIWNIATYAKSFHLVKEEMDESKRIRMELKKHIQVTDSKYDESDYGETGMLKIGEVIFPTGYHSYLLFTCRHEAPVFSLVFSKQSDIVVSGSLDCTCRLWSTKRGNLLFQINLPGVPTSLRMSQENSLFMSCDDRLFKFNIHPYDKEEDMTSEWYEETFKKVDIERQQLVEGKEDMPVIPNLIQNTEIHEPMTPGIEHIGMHIPLTVFGQENMDLHVPMASAKASVASARSPSVYSDYPASSMPPSIRSISPVRLYNDKLIEVDRHGEANVNFKREEEPIHLLLNRTPSRSASASPRGRSPVIHEPDDREASKNVSLAELRKLASHGSVQSSYVESILMNYPEVEGDKLIPNLQTFAVEPMPLLNMMLLQDFNPKDVFKVLSDRSEFENVYKAIMQGNPIDRYMVKKGISKVSNAKDTHITLRKKDIVPPLSDLKAHNILTKGRRERTLEIRDLKDPSGVAEWYNEDDEEGELVPITKYGSDGLPRGTVMHFIPSQILKFLQDYYAMPDLTAKEAGELLLTGKSGTVAKRSNMNYWQTMTHGKNQTVLGKYGKPPELVTQSIKGQVRPVMGKRSMLSTKQPVRNDTYYEGLTVHVNPREAHLTNRKKPKIGHVYTQPFLMRSNADDRFKEQILTGNYLQITERPFEKKPERK